MSFSDEVDATRSARAFQAAHRRELEEPAKQRFAQEVQDLWSAADAYRRARAKVVDLAIHAWAETGHTEGKFGEKKGPRPFPLQRVFQAQPSRPGFSRTRTEWKHRIAVPTESVEAIKINDWFALCGPGAIRELASTHHRGYFQIPWISVRDTVNDGNESIFGMVFVGAKRQPVVVLRCGSDGPIEVSLVSGNDWEPQGTLRELVVSALADMPFTEGAETASNSAPA